MLMLRVLYVAVTDKKSEEKAMVVQYSTDQVYLFRVSTFYI